MDMFEKWSLLWDFIWKFYFLIDCVIVLDCELFYFIFWESLQNVLCHCAIVTMLIVRLWLKVAKFEYWLCDCAKICILIVRLCENMQFDCAIVRLCLIVLIVCDCVVYPEPFFHVFMVKKNLKNIVDGENIFGIEWS